MADNQSIGFEYYTKKALGEFLSEKGVTEVCINRPNEAWLEIDGEWILREIDFDLQMCYHLANALASFKGDKIDETKPVLSCVLKTGERVQVIVPPACEKNTVSITIRKPTSKRFGMDYYNSQGFFDYVNKDKTKEETNHALMALYEDENWIEFLKLAILSEKNIVVSGETGSGKTTFMKTLVDFIPKEERLITIEDTPELNFINHKNYVHLFYPSESTENDIVTASTLLKSCLRMKPDRILLAELRGGETFEFINVLSSGHAGSITSCHAGSPEETFIRLSNMTLQSKQGVNLPYSVVTELLKQVIDIIIQIDVINNQRRITEIYFKYAIEDKEGS